MFSRVCRSEYLSYLLSKGPEKFSIFSQAVEFLLSLFLFIYFFVVGSMENFQTNSVAVFVENAEVTFTCRKYSAGIKLFSTFPQNQMLESR